MRFRFVDGLYTVLTTVPSAGAPHHHPISRFEAFEDLNSSLMKSELQRIQRLSLLIQRVLDAELVSEEEAAQLSSQAEEAHRAMERGDRAVAQRSLENVRTAAEELSRLDSTCKPYGDALVQMAGTLLDDPEVAR